MTSDERRAAARAVKAAAAEAAAAEAAAKAEADAKAWEEQVREARLMLEAKRKVSYLERTLTSTKFKLNMFLEREKNK